MPLVPEPAVETSHIYEKMAENKFVPEKAVEHSPHPTSAAPNGDILAALTSSPPRRSTPPLPLPAQAPMPMPAYAPTPPLPMPAHAPVPMPAPQAMPMSAPVPMPAPHVMPTAAPVEARAPARLDVAQGTEVPSLGQALIARTRVFALELPLWVPMASLMGLLAASVTAVALLSASPSSSPSPSVTQAVPTAAMTASTSPAPAAVTSTPAAATAEPKSGELASAADLVAFAEAAAQKELQAAKEFRQRVKSDPAILKEKTALVELRKLVQDPDTAREALGGIADLPGPTGADILYEVWTGTPSRTDATDLAKALVYATDVRAKASPALAVALDLRRAETCEQSRDLLARATSEGDRRSFNLLAKLKRKQGCGPNKRQDCYACLRDGTALDDAIKAVKTKKAPTPFGS
jgi:hypothetical protein